MKHQRLAATAVVIATIAFGAAIAGRHLVNPWWSNAAAALLSLVAVGIALRSRATPLWHLDLPGVSRAVLLGVALVALTHAGYAAAVELFPDLEAHVAALYAGIDRRMPHPATVPVLIAIIVVAEELVWRELALGLCRDYLQRPWTIAAAVSLYALPQLIGGSLILIGAALGIGTVLTVQRERAGSVAGPVITHTIWSVSIFHALPVA